MSRVITSMHFDLKMIVSPAFPPPCGLTWVDTAADGHESPGRVVLLDAAAQRVWTATDKIAAANAELDALAVALPDLPTIAARMTAVDDLDRQLREKQAALAAADQQITAKQAELATLDAAPAVVAAPATTGTAS